jgi:hypothetical protein
MTSTAELMPVTVREWTDILARIRFGTVRIAGKTYSAARIKLVAHRLANYADSDGTRIHPGIARLAVDLEIEYRTVRDTLALLRRLGLIHRVRPATGRGRADEYRLTLPLDLLDRDDLDVWTPTHHAQHTQKVRDTHRGTSRAPLCTRGPKDPAPTPAGAGTPGPPAPAVPPAPPVAAASPRTATSGCAGSTRTATQGPQDPTTYQDHNTTPTDQPTARVCEPVTVSHASRCVHGLTAERRTDGRPACALCRVAEDRPTIYQPMPTRYVTPAPTPSVTRRSPSGPRCTADSSSGPKTATASHEWLPQLRCRVTGISKAGEGPDVAYRPGCSPSRPGVGSPWTSPK